MGPTDSELLDLHRAGNHKALAELFERHRPAAFTFVWKFVRNHADVEDILQDTLIAVHRGAHQFDVSKKFRPWLFQIAKNKARDFIRRDKRHKHATVKFESEQLGYAEVSEPEYPQVAKIMAKVPAKHRELLNLIYFRGMTLQQVATNFEVSIGTVKSRLNRALTLARKAA